MDFSVILPTKNNIPGLMGLITSFIDKAKDKDCVEFLIAPDIGDPQLNDIKESVKGYPVKVYETHPTDNFNRDYWNWMTFKSHGDRVWCMNDDVVMLTQDWDEIIRQKTKDRNFYLVDTHDSTHDQGGMAFPRFPLISRKAIDTVGFLLYPQVRTYPGDKVVYDLYKRMDLVIECLEVELRHDWIPSTDLSKSKMFKIFQEDIANGVFPVNAFVQVYQLKEAIKNAGR